MGGKGKKKVILTTSSEVVQVLPNGKVRVDKALVKMPFKSADVTIESAENIVTVQTRSFTVKFDVPNDTYYFTLSGWFYGKTGGLLGTYDNERYNDIMTSSNRIVSDVTDFADTWEVDDKCRR